MRFLPPNGPLTESLMWLSPWGIRACLGAADIKGNQITESVSFFYDENRNKNKDKCSEEQLP